MHEIILAAVKVPTPGISVVDWLFLLVGVIIGMMLHMITPKR